MIFCIRSSESSRLMPFNNATPRIVKSASDEIWKNKITTLISGENEGQEDRNQKEMQISTQRKDVCQSLLDNHSHGRVARRVMMSAGTSRERGCPPANQQLVNIFPVLDRPRGHVHRASTKVRSSLPNPTPAIGPKGNKRWGKHWFVSTRFGR